MASLEVVPLLNGRFAENCYLLFDPGHPDTIVIDPGEEPARFLAEASARGRSISAIWLTHAHLDHILGVGAIHAATGAPILLHPADRPLYDGLPEQAAAFGLAAGPPPPPTGALAHGDRLTIGRSALEVRHVPGHSPGHVAFVADGFILGGDVLFEDSIGRTDLPGGDLPTLLESIDREFLSRDDATVVHPGHGPATTIGRERRRNPFLRSAGRGRG